MQRIIHLKLIRVRTKIKQDISEVGSIFLKFVLIFNKYYLVIDIKLAGISVNLVQSNRLQIQIHLIRCVNDISLRIILALEKLLIKNLL